jgi:hypothetical protein
MTKTNGAARSIEEVETAISNVAKLATRGLDDAPRAAQSPADAVVAHANSIIDRVVQEAVAKHRALRAASEENEKFILERAALLQAEVQGLVRMSTGAQTSAEVITNQLADFRADHAEIVNAVTMERAQ